MYSKSKEELEAAEASLKESLKDFPKVLHHVLDTYLKLCPFYVYCYTSSFFTRGSFTNNIVERGFLNLKGTLLQRRKCVNLVNLVFFLTSVLSSCYQMKISDHINHFSSKLKDKEASKAKLWSREKKSRLSC